MKSRPARTISPACPACGALRPLSANRLRRLACAALLLGGAGCGGGGLGFTGGGVPIGKAVLKGRVVAAANPSQPLANAQVTVIATPLSGARYLVTTTTDQNGFFTATDIPTDAVTGVVTADAVSVDGAYKEQRVSFLARNNHQATLIFALPPATYALDPGTKISISPAQVTLQTGQNAHFTAKLTSATGAILPFTPTLTFDDDFGSLNSDGSFTGTGVGSGTVSALWYNNLRATATVSVPSRDTTTTGTPPLPPASSN